ncbi:hypothetical protein U1Q18_011098, partial [Sarracenia purpurea var. burkii]
MDIVPLKSNIALLNLGVSMHMLCGLPYEGHMPTLCAQIFTCVLDLFLETLEGTRDLHKTESCKHMFMCSVTGHQGL